MRILQGVHQGNDDWHRVRRQYFTASEAPAMMGASPHRNRTELLAQKAGAGEPEVSAHKQALFQRGHDAEAGARPIAEELLGEDLFPVTAVDDADWLLASFDGITLTEDIIWEHKLFSQPKAGHVRKGSVPPEDYWQLVHQLYVSGAETALYMISDGTRETCEHTWLHAHEVDFDALVAGWQQFAEDLAEHEPVEPAQPEAVGHTMKDLPALHIELTGEVAASNLPEFRETAMAVLESINTDLQTDQDFADAEETVKWCSDVEKRIEAAKQHALSQTQSIDELFRTLDEVREETRRRRLELDKQVKAQKDTRRAEIRQRAEAELDQHVAELEAAIDSEHGTPVVLPKPACDIAGAMKGKRKLSAIQDAANQVVADAKIEANQTAETVRKNLRTLDELAGEHRSLFHDLNQIVTKDPDDFAAVVKARIADHEAELERKREAERREQEEKERAEREAEARREQEEQAPGPEPEPEQPAQGPGEAEEQPELPIDEPEPAPAAADDSATHAAAQDVAHVTQRLSEALTGIERDAEWFGTAHGKHTADHVTGELRRLLQEINRKEQAA